MNVLGISGRYRDAAAALAVDGRVIAAVSEDCFTKVPGIGYLQTGGFPSQAVAACLESAGLEPRDVDQLTVVEREGPSGHDAAIGDEYKDLSVERIDAVRADAVHAAASADARSAVLVCSTQPPVIAAFVTDRQRVTSQTAIAGGEWLFGAAGMLARTLGVAASDPYGALDRLSVGGDPEFHDGLETVFGWSEKAGLGIDTDGLSRWVNAVGGDQTASLSDAASLNVRVQAKRRAIAASFTCRLAHVVRDAAESLCARGDLDSIVFGGAMFANRRLSSELGRLIGDRLALAAVPEPAGRALGAALSAPAGFGEPLSGLALGPAFSDADIKRTLDNCRLDYVYEPDWQRLFLRTSKLLSQGKVVAWFQGAMGFGPRAMGTRSILCDPSSRYARHNINEYLRQAPLDEPVPVVFAPSVASQCLMRPLSGRVAVMDVAVASEWRDRLAGALDWRHFVRVHAVNPLQAHELCELLECHYRRTQVPALIETNLCGPGEPLACTPRDAVRTVYSSAIDVLVIGRFVLMKDHWLLRSDVG